ncbi:polysaccharide deacetylase [Streptomyces sp. NPDC005840]|jgi:peptidoglycan-N-acetylglucosamine deacetylase|uniref:Polysaccharide deacetylase n=1 Tax=Streptomyces doudnae TaxID=3075536 RepID=A0ABD5F1V2_9ACTN|nr:MULTISPECIES: polysaccharide deacetylase [unclassified Streptomyces]MDT0440520.1 polysaccharide deacetylase [Streptomyces sp. DSM 41981]MYQ64869.1 polysaccharide deacetylase family protein [Streptomyces sp. SID4950]SCD87872.1 Polysaccharide deacetylase [Streptomyces sp. SolWspMP-5a-2]
MPLNLPEGKTLAVNIGADFDAHSVWMGTFNLSSPSYLSRGEFCAEVGVPRLISLFERHGVRATWCTPGHTMVTFPERVRQIVDAGHEIAAHGCYHEGVPKLDADTERRLMEAQLAQHERYIGVRPRGYRSPAWDFTDQTMSVLEENGFEWDSSLMGRDFEPYHPRPVQVGWEEGSTFGPASPLLEFPVSWFLDDFPAAEYIPGVNQGLGSSEVMFQRWRDHFDYAYRNVPGGVLTLTVHPQTIARAHYLMGFERLIEYMAGHTGTWFAPLSDIYDTWTED